MDKPKVIAVDLLAYTAGLVDGEGSIQINPIGLKKGRKGKRYWNLTVQVSGNDGTTLKDLRDKWQLGTITKWKPQGSRRKRTSYNWRIYSREAAFLLVSLLPYLRIKKENVQIALEFQKFVGRRGTFLSKESSAKRTKLALKMRELNQKYGKAKLTNTTLAYEVL